MKENDDRKHDVLWRDSRYDSVRCVVCCFMDYIWQEKEGTDSKNRAGTVKENGMNETNAKKKVILITATLRIVCKSG